MRIREAEDGDVESVHRIEMSTFRTGEAYYPSHFLAFLRSKAEIFIVAEVEGGVVGYAIARVRGCTLAIEVDHRVEGWLHKIAVHPDWQRRGIGTRLMKEMLKRLASRGVDLVVLEVRRGNSEAQRFYEKLGFELVQIVHNFYFDREPAHRLILDMTSWESARLSAPRSSSASD